jgi:hypothetical protein
MKTDRTDNQLLEFSTVNNHHSIVQQTITDRVDQIDHTRAIQTAVMHQEQTTIVKDVAR